MVVNPPAAEWPRISVVTPSFNQGRFVARTLDSVLSQNYPNLEYIVIDGGSTDDSVAHIRARADRLAFWCSESDKGHADALNKGFRRATGSLLTFINSDDYLLPGSLWTAARTFLRWPAVDILHGGVRLVDVDDRQLMEKRTTRFFAAGYFCEACDLPQPGTFWRRWVYETVGEFSLEYHFSFDTEFFYRALVAGARVSHVREFLSAFRLHPAAKTARLQDTSAADNCQLRERFVYPRYGALRRTAIRVGVRTARATLFLCQGDGAWLCGQVARRLLPARQVG